MTTPRHAPYLLERAVNWAAPRLLGAAVVAVATAGGWWDRRPHPTVWWHARSLLPAVAAATTQSRRRNAVPVERRHYHMAAFELVAVDGHVVRHGDVGRPDDLAERNLPHTCLCEAVTRVWWHARHLAPALTQLEGDPK